ncbi:SMI1/KNR4 family protein [Kitasatospora sp. NPDC088391]|uniref:SMI1/KNR4 family protein n=1 Tax=Kitasatospora sp. NPDC088391 TaxID=3364074 RepID=UPI00381BA859
MALLSEVRSLLGEPGVNRSYPEPWAEMEREFGVELPADFREVVDAYGSVLINDQLYLEHPAGPLPHNLQKSVRDNLDFWEEEDSTEFLPGPVGAGPGELMPIATGRTSETVFLRVPAGPSSPWRVLVQEFDSFSWALYEMTFGEWLLAYLRGEDVMAGSRNFGSDGAFYEPLP